MTIRLALLTVLVAACHSKSAPPAQPANAAAATPAATEPAGAVDCGTVDTTSRTSPPNERAAYECFVEAYQANRAATVAWLAVTDEGGEIITTYKSVPGNGSTVLVMTIDDRDDGFAASPGIHELICTSLRIEKTTSNGVVLYPEGCSGAL